VAISFFKLGHNVSMLMNECNVEEKATDIKDRSLSLRDKKGKSFLLKLGIKRVLEQVKVGETVKVRIEEGSDSPADWQDAEDISG
jgi:hypothetical protein